MHENTAELRERFAQTYTSRAPADRPNPTARPSSGSGFSAIYSEIASESRRPAPGISCVAGYTRHTSRVVNGQICNLTRTMDLSKMTVEPDYAAASNGQDSAPATEAEWINTLTFTGMNLANLPAIAPLIALEVQRLRETPERRLVDVRCGDDGLAVRYKVAPPEPIEMVFRVIMPDGILGGGLNGAAYVHIFRLLRDQGPLEVGDLRGLFPGSPAAFYEATVDALVDLGFIIRNSDGVLTLSLRGRIVLVMSDAVPESTWLGTQLADAVGEPNNVAQVEKVLTELEKQGVVEKVDDISWRLVDDIE